jgi:hypothetical protein
MRLFYIVLGLILGCLLLIVASHFHINMYICMIMIGVGLGNLFPKKYFWSLQ